MVKTNFCANRARAAIVSPSVGGGPSLLDVLYDKSTLLKKALHQGKLTSTPLVVVNTHGSHQVRPYCPILLEDVMFGS
eukprot:4059831-Amphidinium_carterae.1